MYLASCRWDELVDTAIGIAQEIAEKSRIAAAMTKETVDKAFETTLAEGVIFERRAFHSMFGTDDQKEGMAAVVEKRKANWKHS